jgi:Amt family ammonium transporter
MPRSNCGCAVLLAHALLFIFVNDSLANEVDDLKQLLNITLDRVKELEKWKTAADSGHTAWVMRAGNLIHLLCLPGLSLFYGGMAQVQDVLSTVFQTFCVTCFISVLWFFMGYSLALGEDNAIFGGAQRFWLIGPPPSSASISVDSQHALAPGIPESTYFVFQMGIANITAIIVCSSFAERMRFRSMLAFLLPWHLLVYCPVAHAVWAAGGFLRRAGSLDFAGGGVVHVCGGLSALAAALALGPRTGFAAADARPHSLVHTLVGACLVCAGRHQQ